MILSAIKHGFFCPFRQPVARNKVRFRLLAARNDLMECSITYWKRSEPAGRKTVALSFTHHDQTADEWLVEICHWEEIKYLKYFFCLKDHQGKTVYFCDNGFFDSEPASGFFELLQVNQSDVIQPPEWTRGMVYYQIFPERFSIGQDRPKSHTLEDWNARPTRENFLGGDLTGIEKKLPYLQELGVDCVYMTPIFAADYNHKYATTDYFSVDPDFGTKEELQKLVQSAHAAGIRVILDGVFNHCGIHLEQFEDLVLHGEKSRFRDWFFPKRFPISIDERSYECVGDYPYMPRLNTGNEQVQAFILSVMRYWIEQCGIDGWRLDVADELDAQCVQFLRRSLKAEYPELLLLGETWGDGTRMLCGNDQFDSVMNYVFRDAMVDYFAHGSINEEELDWRLQHMLMQYPREITWEMYNCLSSHDTARFLTEAKGEKWRLKLAIAFQILFPGSPAVYYGEEIGMMGENDPDCRAGMQWDAQDGELFAWTKDMIRLRHEHEAIRTGAYRTLLYDTDKKLFVFERSNHQERLIAAFNTSDCEQRFEIDGDFCCVSAYGVRIVKR